MLQKNERIVLQHLAENARTTDSAIAEAAGISTQAVGKIRRKLEEEGIIRGYVARLDGPAIGLEVVNIVSLFVPHELLEDERTFREAIVAEEHVIDCYRLSHGHVNVLLVCAFRSLAESEEYFKRFQREFPHLEILELQTSTWDMVWKNTKRDAYLLALKARA